ncbi:hypothetical protein O6H91_19G008600 [Diphasiastrum complanatum]|uniref:Uncharacterized protein n=1 Tax=Diphasiastrum complanatum TaxID=34168 RepID=A0ACC2ASJ5_DIPCM|nr:hypothetical protein O6H91_19G008600 [Diphasiastrum complanatum]
MHNSWGGSFEISNDQSEETDKYGNLEHDGHLVDYSSMDRTKHSWLLGEDKWKSNKYVDLGCILCSKKLLKGITFLVIVCMLVAGIIFLIVKTTPKKHHVLPPSEDNYTLALRKALLFFNAQKSGHLPPSNNISYRGNSALSDGLMSTPPVDLVGGYYDSGDNIKFNFPAAFTITMLSWSVIEYSAKYEAAGELEHVQDLIQWGADYLLKTFKSSAQSVDIIYAQVGQGVNKTSEDLNDLTCWERPESMDYPRPVSEVQAGSDLAGEMAAALAAASIVFRGRSHYARTLVDAAAQLFKMARDRRGIYTKSATDAAFFYNSSGYWDEFIWGGAWLYFATGNTTYLNIATKQGIADHALASNSSIPSYGVFSWDNKLPGAQVLLTRLKLLQSPGYPYETVLDEFNTESNDIMCSYLPYYHKFPRTAGGLILLEPKRSAPLQNAATIAFLAALYADYLSAADVPGWYCGPTFYSVDTLRNFSKSQIDYILGKNPQNMSYMVGFGNKYPLYVHHRASSIPYDHKTYTCKGGFDRWFHNHKPNPNVLEGAMMGGPDRNDHYTDTRAYNHTQPTIAGNAGLVAALVALSEKGTQGVDAQGLFAAIPPNFPPPSPPTPPWTP